MKQLTFTELARQLAGDFVYDPDLPRPAWYVQPKPAKCECGSGSDELSGAHSHWCPRWLKP